MKKLEHPRIYTKIRDIGEFSKILKQNLLDNIESIAWLMNIWKTYNYLLLKLFIFKKVRMLCKSLSFLRVHFCYCFKYLKLLNIAVTTITSAFSLKDGLLNCWVLHLIKFQNFLLNMQYYCNCAVIYLKSRFFVFGTKIFKNTYT